MLTYNPNQCQRHQLAKLLASVLVLKRLLIDFHPDNNLSALAGSLKSASSRIIQKEFSEHLATIYKQSVLWSGSYYVASTGGAPIERIKQYIQSQETPSD